LIGSGKPGTTCGKGSENSKNRTLATAAPDSPLRQATRIHYSPTAPLLRRRKDLTKPPRRQAILLQEVRLAKKEHVWSRRWKARPLLGLWRNASSQARTRKQSRQRVMAESVKVPPNSHLRHLFTKAFWQELPRERSRRQANPLSFRYSQSIPPFFLAFLNLFMRLSGKDRTRDAWAPPPRGKWREKTLRPLEQKIQAERMRQEGNRSSLPQQLPLTRL
jgi:hypothetical protein